MNLKITNFAILINLTFLLSCGNSIIVKPNNKSKVKDEIAHEILIEEVKTPPKEKIKPTSEVYQSQIPELEKSEECIFKRKDIHLAKIREVIGDTIKIKNTYDWVSSLELTDDDNEIRKKLRRGGKFFQINETEKYVTIGFIEDEGEYLGIYIYTIDKESCEIIGNELLAETTGWEHGYKETFSIIENDFTIKREKKIGAKDWGDYTKWKRDTTITMITFDEKGKINLEKK